MKHVDPASDGFQSLPKRIRGRIYAAHGWDHAVIAEELEVAIRTVDDWMNRLQYERILARKREKRRRASEAAVIVPMRESKLSRADRLEIEARRAAGEKLTKLAQDYDVSPGTIHYHTRHIRKPECGWTRPYYVQPDAEQVVGLRRNGLTIREIAQRTGFCRTTIWRTLHRHKGAVA